MFNMSGGIVKKMRKPYYIINIESGEKYTGMKRVILSKDGN